MENLTKATIEKIEELVLRGEVPHVVEIEGKKYSQRSLYELSPKKYLEGLTTTSLVSFVDFVKKTLEDKRTGYVIQIKDHTGVVLYEPVDEEMKRNKIMSAMSQDVTHEFLDRYVSPEEMIINLRRTAEEGVGDFETVIKIISGITKQQEVRCTDDGLGQVTALVQGTIVIGQAEIRNMVAVSLRRTFLDLPSIEEQFILRVKDGKVALFGANSNFYKKSYFEIIKNLLVEALKEEIEAGLLLII